MKTDPIQAIMEAQKELAEVLRKLLAGEITCSQASAAARKARATARTVVKRLKRGGKAGGQS